MSDSKPAPMSAEKQALLALRRMKARLDESERARREPIAIVGLGCRFPGGATTPDKFWALLRDGVDAIEEVPADRWNLEEFYDSEPGVAGKMCTRFGGFVEGLDRFDPQFFGMAPREAVSLDPQQRLVLEVAWEALEDAGIAADRLAGTDTGVFVGISTQDYAQFQLMFGAGALDTYFGTGNAVNAVAGRLSYVLGLQGPSLAVDTACSSSLTTVHLACQSLRAGECRVALAGGVNSILLPEVTASFSRARMMAPDGRCKTFDAAADGYVRGEGCGIVVLKRLSDAEADGDRILAVIRGSAINQDGRSTGFTAPNERSQEELIRRALAVSGLAASEIDYVEAHGTGTALGDPIEVQALAAALGEGRAADRPIRVGSVKTNCGHLEAAAGIAGLIKVVLALGREELPPSLHFTTPNPLIAWSELPVEVVSTRTPWARTNIRRIAGVSAFGFTGMNAHVIVEDAPAPAARMPEMERPVHLVALSAKTPAALTALADRHVAALDVGQTSPPGDVAFTANVGRSHFEERLVVRAATAEALRAGLLAAVEGREMPGLVRGSTNGAAPRVAFAFTGQGSQYAGMARVLYATQPTFRKAIDRCAAILKDELPQPLVEVLYPAEGAASPIDETRYTQPALFAIEYALAELWRSWGIQPAVVLGHSVGEYVAACIAGVFSLEDALKLAATRGRLMQALPAGGTMAAVGTSEAAVRAVMTAYPQVSIAAVNGPAQVVISGPQADVARLVATLEATGVTVQTLTTSHAFHSALVEPMLDAFEAVARTVTYRAPQVPVISNVTGHIAAADELVTPAYWRRHARGTVRWTASLQTLEASGCGVVVEVGPTATLTALGQSQTTLAWRPSLRRGREDWTTLVDTVAQLYVAGAPIDWAGFDLDYDRRKVALPTYPFQRERYWVPFTRHAARAVDVERATAQHPWLGTRTELGSGETIFESRLAFDDPSFLADHRILDAAIVPASMFVEMVLAAAAEVLGAAPVEIVDLAIDEALMLSRGAARTTQLLLRPGTDSASFEIFSCEAARRVRGDWRRHASGRVSAVSIGAGDARAEGLDAVAARCAGEVPADLLYPADSLIQLGPAFRGVQRLWRSTGHETIGDIALPDNLSSMVAECHAHPALLDACIQAVGPLLPQGDPAAAPSAFVLIGVDRLRLRGSLPSRVWSHVSVRTAAAQAGLVVADVRVYDRDAREAASIEGLRFRRVRRDTLLRAVSSDPDCLYTLDWERQPLALRDDPPTFRSMAAVAADGARSFETLRTEHGLDRYQRFVAELDELSLAYVTNAMRDLGWSLEAGDIVDPSALAARLGVLPKLSRLWSRLFEMLVEGGIVESTKIGMRATGRSPAISAEMATADLRRRHHDRSPDIDVFHRCASRLRDVLRGEVDPLQLLFPGASLDAVEQLVQHTPVARTLNAVVRDTIMAAVERLPERRPLRILEIGAGTGGTTACVVPMLPADRVEYVFTDVSPIFLARARAKFADYPFMRFATLDIERDPIGQEFAAHHFDIVIAANVVHATRDLRQTLGNVQQLIASNGMLALLEVVQRQRAVDLTFGLTDGWWRFEDVDLRPTYPLMPSADWIALLRSAGFASAEAVPPPDAIEMPPQAVIIAQGPSLDRTLDRRAQLSEQVAWVVVGNDPVAAALVERFEKSGYRCVAASNAEGFEQVLRGELARGSGIRGVVNVGRPFLHTAHELSPDNLDRAVADECRSALSLIQDLIKADLGVKPRCWFVTRGTQPAGGAVPTVPVQAPVWGLARSFAVEHPELWGGVIDIDAGASPLSADAIFDEISSGAGEDVVALRGTDRFVWRLTASPGLTGGASFRADAEYLITGGTGGMALNVARWMAEHGARYISLAARREPAASVVLVVNKLEAETGAQVSFVRADVSDEGQTAAALSSLRSSGRPLRGIVHCAGVFDDRVLLNHDWPRFERVLAPKVKGAWILHEQTKSDPLDFFVLCSSAASVLPGSGLANYAAANAFLDALAHYRRSLGRPALSINWCPWADTGMAEAVGGAREGQWSQAGLSTISSDEGLAVLSQALGGSAPQYAVLPIDWTKYIQRFAPGVRPALLSRVAPRNAAGGSAVEPADELRGNVDRALEAQRYDVILAHVRDRVGEVLGFGGTHRVDPERGLFDIGLDSLTAVELRNVLQKSVGQPLPSTLVFDYPSVRTLSGFIAREVFHLDAAPAPDAEDAAPEHAVGDDRQSLSEDELADLLMQKLSRMQS